MVSHTSYTSLASNQQSTETGATGAGRHVPVHHLCVLGVLCGYDNESVLSVITQVKEGQMADIGLFFGSDTGNTAKAAGLIRQAFDAVQPGLVTVMDIATHELHEMGAYDKLILGCPTWNIGELQSDWDRLLPQMDTLDLSGRQVALFGLGDEGGYPDTYQDAIGIIGEKARERGATLVGFWPTAGYDFLESRGVEDGMFMGLMLDDDNAPELTPERIKVWVQQLVQEFGVNT
jgi:flavodoxin I